MTQILYPRYFNDGPVSFSISPSLPTGLIFNETTGIIFGTPLQSQPSLTYLITATSGFPSTNISTQIHIQILGGCFIFV